MRLIRRLVLLVVALWLVAEIVAIPIANSQIEKRVAEQTQGVAAVHASVGSFPIVARLLLTGRLSKATITLDRVERLRLTFAEVRFDLQGVQMDRTLLFKREARITAIDRGMVTATLDLRTLPPIVARAARNVRVNGRTLVLGAASFEMSSDILPCNPSSTMSGDEVTLSCTFDHVPPVLLEAQRI